VTATVIDIDVNRPVWLVVHEECSFCGKAGIGVCHVDNQVDLECPECACFSVAVTACIL